MAKISSSAMLCMLLALTLFTQDFAECSSRGASTELLHRKLFLELKKLAVKNGGGNNYGNKAMPEDWQLRRVPAGPDPLHHNGHGPKKPTTP